jgi:hypothetical protein
MQTEPRYHTTATCSRPVYGYLLDAGDELEATDLFGGDRANAWEACKHPGHVLSNAGGWEGIYWIRPCVDPHASEDLRKLTNWAVTASHDLCAAGLALKSHARKVRAAVDAGDPVQIKRALDALDSSISLTLGREVKRLSIKASELTEQLHEVEKASEYPKLYSNPLPGGHDWIEQSPGQFVLREAEKG